ncbi:Zn(2)-C6 fungal-type domain-containing protein [Fusarium keratoplasticum]|uniref:Zn(2)-C6 fungal-type domain-containing protein n=1 Tax=Fusarium keratoplasticum TaxID=1328300 RepID=A0ACC0QPQ0_9HYPO|nr:Zn(2)-C6 fungal-type domain-containing protein [Fusarium keratoplasticum]KAI8663161.1 Zn(2)-C6 fungal-type domain-containing protein [Fusarium keratoplasticum]
MATATQSRETARVLKRSGNTGGDAGKRRAPYVLRACGACRRRKGKCDGRQPCRYCMDRGQSCSYSTSFESDGWNVDTVQARPRQDPGRANSPSSSSSNQESMVELLSSLQDQLDNLASQVHMANRDRSNSPSPISSAGAAKLHDFATGFNNEASAHDVRNTADKRLRAAGSPGFYGPTSPDYTLNVGQLKLRRNSCPGPPLQEQQLQLASIDEDAASDTIDDEAAQDERSSVSPRTVGRQDATPLLTFRSIMGLQEAIQLVHIYQEVVGDLHPVVDIDALIKQAQYWYADSDSGAASCELLMIFNLVLVIALRADPRPNHCHKETLLRDSFEDAVNAKLAAPAYSIKHVTIIFLKGWYDFFQEMPRSAWRMCGIAGRTLMELGFHNGQVFNHTLTSDAQRTEACILISSIVILDRQWSYATGLPLHFHENSFSSISTSSVQHPYLKAMLSFILISDRFGEPISRAAKGERYTDDDAFELLNFQIDQWRKKAVGNYTLSECRTWHTNPSTRPPTWAILLNLRAESVRSQLLKPFFFSESDIEITKNHLRAATELVYDICHVLYMLDTYTDIYRKQHPYFQHILACTSGLAFLVIAFLKQNKTTVLSNLAPDLVDSLGGSFLMAECVTLNHAKRSRSARRLAKRLVEMRRILLSLGLLRGPSTGDSEEETLANTSKSIPREGFIPQPEMLDFQSQSGYTPPLYDGNVSDGFGFNMPSTLSDTDVIMGWTDSLRLQWPIGDVSHMFSESSF